MTEETRPENRRRRLIDSGPVLADELIARHEFAPRGDISGSKLVITVGGAFEFQVGRSVAWVDSARLLFARDGESYVDRHVVPNIGHVAVILTPDEDTVDEAWGKVSTGRTRACSLRVQHMTHLLRRTSDPLAAQEIGLRLVEEAAAGPVRPMAFDQRCVRRAKAALHACAEGRLTLGRLAADIGVSPLHLTQSFRRSEGVPLYRYQSHLRLVRALDRLPDRDDLTELALELGFSSHSHFSAAFRARTGMTPSAYRAQSRSAAA